MPPVLDARVKELAKQAGFPAWWMTPPEPDRQNGESLAMLERFADLLLQDCFKQLVVPGVPAPVQGGLNLAKVALEMHFGTKATTA